MWISFFSLAAMDMTGATILPFRIMASELPNRIRELRKARNMKLEDLANRVDCAVSMMSDLERGKKELSWTWMKRIARALKVQMADLLAEKDNSKSLSAQERELVDLYTRADDQQRQQLLGMARLIVGPAAPAKLSRVA